MINASPSLELAEVLSGASLATYLMKNGWSARPSKIEGISILSKQLGGSAESVELILPIVPGFTDEKRRVADALRTVEAIEGRPMKSIVDDVCLLQMMERLAQDPVWIEKIQRLVARHYNVSRSDLLSSRRTANVRRPRQIAMYLAKTMTPSSWPEIGSRFGGRDPATVMNAVCKIEAQIAVDNTLAVEIETLKSQLQ
jgi:chromosomal replication initiation ATPase DnaA